MPTMSSEFGTSNVFPKSCMKAVNRVWCSATTPLVYLQIGTAVNWPRFCYTASQTHISITRYFNLYYYYCKSFIRLKVDSIGFHRKTVWKPHVYEGITQVQDSNLWRMSNKSCYHFMNKSPNGISMLLHIYWTAIPTVSLCTAHYITIQCIWGKRGIFI